MKANDAFIDHETVQLEPGASTGIGGGRTVGGCTEADLAWTGELRPA